jgi:hypothetical protein
MSGPRRSHYQSKTAEAAASPCDGRLAPQRDGFDMRRPSMRSGVLSVACSTRPSAKVIAP